MGWPFFVDWVMPYKKTGARAAPAPLPIEAQGPWALRRSPGRPEKKVPQRALNSEWRPNRRKAAPNRPFRFQSLEIPALALAERRALACGLVSIPDICYICQYLARYLL
jgi:hypothetical protein